MKIMVERLVAKFTMKGDYFEITIKSGSASKIELEITFADKEIPEQELRNLELSIRLLLEACGRFAINPSRR